MEKHNAGRPTRVVVKFAQTDGGTVLTFHARSRSSPGFVEGLREIGANDVTIAAAEGRVDEVKRLGKKLVEAE
jgi:hypothetical protein